MNYFLGIDIGGTKVAVSLWTETAQLLDKLRFEMVPGPTPDEVFNQLIQGGQALLAKHQVTHLKSIGISSAGPIDVPAGLIVDAPNLPGWKNVQIVAPFKKAFGVPVRLENDANAAALAEWQFGAGRGHQSLIYITLSSGVGGGLILNNQLWAGFRGNAGEVGHIVLEPQGKLCACGFRGCWEAYCGGKNVQKDLAEHPNLRQSLIWQECGGDTSKLQFVHLTNAVRKSDAFAKKYFDAWVRYNAMALANLFYAYDPEIIVLGTIAYHQGDLFMESLISQVQARLWPVYQPRLKIVATALGEQIGDYAAFAVAR
jgi:glucokinase